MTGLAGLAPKGRLRAAINTGNRALVQVVAGALEGPSPTLARRLAREIGVPLEPVLYEGAGRVFADAGRGVWDVAFLAVDATRAQAVSFTRPYHRIKATYAVREGGQVTSPEDADREGVTILASQGSAYQLHLERVLRHATLRVGGTPGETFERFRAGEGDLVAGVRESLRRAFDGTDGIRVLPGTLVEVRQAMVLPGPGAPLLPLLDAFVAREVARGLAP